MDITNLVSKATVVTKDSEIHVIMHAFPGITFTHTVTIAEGGNLDGTPSYSYVTRLSGGTTEQRTKVRELVGARLDEYKTFVDNFARLYFS